MTDFHHNIFYYYRGAKDSDQDRERQFEDNTTKALINTLKHGDPKVVIKFLKWLGINATENINFELQKKTIGERKISHKSQRLLLALVPAKRSSTNFEKSLKEDSRPDAWIYGDDFVVLIESKIVGYTETNQMRYHFQKLQSNTNESPRYEEQTWADVHHFFTGILTELSGKSEFIVKQFIQYLEWNSMADFIGFEKEIFDFFFTHDDDETRVWVRDTIQAFAEKIRIDLNKFNSFYQDYDMGTLHLKDDYCWVAFGPKDKIYWKDAHQTITVDAQGIEVFVNVELKSAIGKLRAKIRHDKNSFKKVISQLEIDDPFCVKIEERKQMQASSYTCYPIARIEARYLKDSELGQSCFEYIQFLLEQVPLPYLTVRKRIDRKLALELSQKDQGKSLVDKLVFTMKAFHPLVRYINQADYST